MNNFRDKTFASTFIYTKKNESGASSEQQLIEFIKTADRVNKNHASMNQINNMIKERAASAVLYRVFMSPDTVIAISKDKELPASFKVFSAKDIGSVDQKNRVFIDATGLFKYENGYFSCKNIDVLCTYLMSAMVTGSYYKDSYKFISNNTIVRSAATCFVKLFTNVLDNLRVTNYNENRNKIAYISCIYFLVNMIGKDLRSAQALATNLLSLNAKDTNAYDYYYDEEIDFNNIDTLVKSLAENFKLKGLTTDIYLNRWLTLYGKGTLYGTELLPAFLTIITNAYSGTYVNRQNMIENICGREVVTLSTQLIRTGSEIFDKGFKYESNMRNDLFYDNNKK